MKLSRRRMKKARATRAEMENQIEIGVRRGVFVLARLGRRWRIMRPGRRGYLVPVTEARCLYNPLIDQLAALDIIQRAGLTPDHAAAALPLLVDTARVQDCHVSYVAQSAARALERSTLASVDGDFSRNVRRLAERIAASASSCKITPSVRKCPFSGP